MHKSQPVRLPDLAPRSVASAGVGVAVVNGTAVTRNRRVKKYTLPKMDAT